MKNPLDSLWGPVISGFVLTAILWSIARAIVSHAIGSRRMSSSNDWIFRWFHIMAGIMWIGLLYFFNFVNAAAVKEATAAGEAGPISKYIMPRALLFFRWGAVVTWIFGAALLANFPGPGGMNGFVAAFTFRVRWRRSASERGSERSC